MRLRATDKPAWFGRQHTRSSLLRFIALHRVVRRNAIPAHRLPCWELAVVDTGELALVIDGSPLKVPAGHAGIIPPRALIESGQGVNAGTMWWIGLDPKAALGEWPSQQEQLLELARLLEQHALGSFPCGSEVLLSARACFDLCAGEQRNTLLLQGAVATLAGHLVQAMQAPVPTLSTENMLIRAAFEMIDQSPGRRITVGELARACRLSRTTFSETFRRVVGLSPHAYMSRKRISAACDLLRASDQAIADISRQLGFSSSQYFASAFKRIEGLTPAEYRTQSRAKSSGG